MDKAKATELAAQCWCDPTTSHIEMNTALADVIAVALTNAYLNGWKDCTMFANSCIGATNAIPANLP